MHEHIAMLSWPNADLMHLQATGMCTKSCLEVVVTRLLEMERSHEKSQHALNKAELRSRAFLHCILDIMEFPPCSGCRRRRPAYWWAACYRAWHT